LKLSVPLTNLPSGLSFPNFLHQSQDISWLSPSKCSHLYIWSQWGWNVLFLFVASYALLLSRVSTFHLDFDFETPGKDFHIFFYWKSSLELVITHQSYTETCQKYSVTVNFYYIFHIKPQFFKTLFDFDEIFTNRSENVRSFLWLF
jgi:hypothetical protein